MKVLWFCNTCANSDEFFNSDLKGTGGWLKALDQSLQNYVELHISFYSQHPESFKFKNAFYHPIGTNRSMFEKVLEKVTGYKNDAEDIPKYLGIINKIKPDIIHIHGTENPFAGIIPHCTIPVVISIQGNLTVIMHKYFSGIKKRYLNLSYKTTSSLSGFLFPWTFKLQYKMISKLQKRELINIKISKYILGRTHWDERITRVLAPNSIYFHEDRILRDSFYCHQWLPHNRDKIIVHTTITNAYYKGFETVCLALNELNKIGFNCEWHIAGLDETDLIVKITKKQLGNNYPQLGVVLLGKLNENELIKSLLNSDIYVMSSHIENNANNLCEAMIIGMPCISTFVGGIGSLIRDGIEGILIQNGDPWAMAGSVLEIIKNKEKGINLGKNARKVAIKRHDAKRIIIDLLKTYESVLNITGLNCESSI